MLKRRLLVVISFGALCLSVAPAMADFLDLAVYDTKMTVTTTDGVGMAATTTIEARVPGTSYMNMFVKDDGGSELQSLITEPYNLTAVLDFMGSGNNYSATGSLEVYDTVDVDPKIAAEFESTMLTFASSYNPWAQTYIGTITMTGYLTPQDTSILLGDSPWVYVGKDVGLGSPTLTLNNPADFTHGTMAIFEYNVQFETFQKFLAVSGADGSGMLNATIHSAPIPAAVLLGIIGLGVVGLKLRKFA